MANTLENGVDSIVPENGLSEKIELAKSQSRPMIIKLGFDPTAPDLHLGHAVVLKKLKEFQDLGHTVVVILGDFTASIGDPTGKNKARPPLSTDQIDQNVQTYLDQLSKVLDISKTQIRYNSEWYNKMSMKDSIELISSTTLAQILERNDFRQRYESGSPISMHELIYPILQGYDSVVVESDVEIGGTDQLFNILVGRYMQQVRQMTRQAVLCMPLLRGVDGSEKMSKSQNNYIGLTENPEDMFGKVMSIPDALLGDYIDLATDWNMDEKNEIKKQLSDGENPMLIKKKIASNVVTQYHDQESSVKAEAHFYQQVQSRDFSSREFKSISIDSLELPLNNIKILDLCLRLDSSRSKTQMRQLISSGAISIDGIKISDPQHIFDSVKSGLKIKIGKRGFYELVEH